MKPIYTFVRYYRKPYPSGNWCPRYACVYRGKELIEKRLNSNSIKYSGKRGENAEIGHKDACNIVADYRESLEWDQILDLGEIELTVSEFKRYEYMFKETLSTLKGK